MKYEIGGTDWVEALRVQRDPLGREWQVEVADGTVHQFKLESLDSRASFRMTVGESVHTVTVLPGNRPGQPLRFLCDDEYWELEVRDPIDLLASALGDAGGVGGIEEILSAMPGVIRKVLVEPGQTVEAGQPILILEAMKMENEVESPIAGTVASIEISPGDTVATGALLARVDGGS